MNNFKLKERNVHFFMIWIYLIVSSASVIQLKIPNQTKLVLVIELCLAVFFLFAVFVHYKLYKGSLGKFMLALTFCLVSMAFSSMFHMLLGYNGYERGNFVVDLIAVAVIFYGIRLSKLNIQDQLRHVLFIMSICGTVIGAYAILKSNFRIRNVNERAVNTLEIQYFLWKLLEVWPMLILLLVCQYKQLTNRKIILAMTIACTLEYMVLSFLFMKRMVFFDLIVLAIVIALANRLKPAKFLKYSIIVIAATILGAIFAQKVLHINISLILGMTLERFTGVTVSNFDRLNEFKDVFKEFGAQFVFFGMGFGSSHSRAGGLNLHMGILNFIFKGGIPLFLLVVYSGFKSLFALISKIPMQYKFYPAVVVYTLARSIVSPFWVPNPTRIIFAICLGLTLQISGSSRE